MLVNFLVGVLAGLQIGLGFIAWDRGKFWQGLMFFGIAAMLIMKLFG